MRHPALIGYLKSRGIVPAIADAFCKEVGYSIGDRSYFAVGFRNDAGGWELRNARFKGGSTPKHIMTIDRGGDAVLVFEGFMDLLSYLSLKKSTSPGIDAAVLNSVVNLPKALPFLQRHRTIHAFLDNDDAGRKTTAEIVRLCDRCEVVDQSRFYAGYKDVNEYWHARIRNEQQRQRTQLRTAAEEEPTPQPRPKLRW